MKIKSKNFIIPLIIYPFDVMVSVNQEYDDFAKAVIKKWDSSILDDFKKYQTLNQDAITYIFVSDSHLCAMLKLNNFDKSSVGYGTLSHEIFHAAEFVLRKVGMPLSNDSMEAYAYLIGYLTQEIHKKL